MKFMEQQINNQETTSDDVLFDGERIHQIVCETMGRQYDRRTKSYKKATSAELGKLNSLLKILLTSKLPEPRRSTRTPTQAMAWKNFCDNIFSSPLLAFRLAKNTPEPNKFNKQKNISIEIQFEDNSNVLRICALYPNFTYTDFQRIAGLEDNADTNAKFDRIYADLVEYVQSLTYNHESSQTSTKETHTFCTINRRFKREFTLNFHPDGRIANYILIPTIINGISYSEQTVTFEEWLTNPIRRPDMIAMQTGDEALEIQSNTESTSTDENFIESTTIAKSSRFCKQKTCTAVANVATNDDVFYTTGNTSTNLDMEDVLDAADVVISEIEITTATTKKPRIQTDESKQENYLDFLQKQNFDELHEKVFGCISNALTIPNANETTEAALNTTVIPTININETIAAVRTVSNNSTSIPNSTLQTTSTAEAATQTDLGMNELPNEFTLSEIRAFRMFLEMNRALSQTRQ